MHKPGIVICSRLDSERLPNKVARKINGIPILVHLIKRLVSLDIPIIVAVPWSQAKQYADLIEPYPELDIVHVVGSHHAEDPLARNAEMADKFNLSHVVRITHDKIFVDKIELAWVLEKIKREMRTAEYIYSSQLTPGTGFEVIEAGCLKRTAEEFKGKNVEHISYAARLVSKNTINFTRMNSEQPFNLLLDFPEDLQLMEIIYSALGSDCQLSQVIEYLKRNPELAYINCPPIATVYTCAYNAEKWIDKAMNSVAMQSMFNESMEYIIIDDHSKDSTYEKIAKFALNRKNVFHYRNDSNVGLASSSNLALKRARGRYLIRLDADDFFVRETAIMELLKYAQKTRDEIIYPDNYMGALDKIQKGNECHHVGGALFDKRALNFIKFTDGLRNYEGLDLFVRAKEKLKIGYYEKPVFFYSQHPQSMSKTNLEERVKLRKSLEAKL